MIVIDGFPLLFLPGGIKSYLIALLKALNASEFAQENNFIILMPKVNTKIKAFHHKEAKELESTLDVHFTFQYIRINPFLFTFYTIISASDAFIRRNTLFLWEHYYLPHTVKKLHPTVILHPYQAVSNYKTSARKLVVVHDIFHWVENQQYSFVVKYLYDTFKKGCINCDTILTISKTSKDEIVEYLKLDERKVVVVYEGVDDLFATFSPSEENEKKIISYYKLPTKYLFALISVREYKNAKGILEVFKIVSNQDPELRLVLVGWAIGPNSFVTEYIKANKLEDKIIIISQLRTQEDLPYLYYLSYAFLFPSFKEGFGLPPLEAIACNTLPIVSNVSAIDEIYSGILPSFNPLDYQKMAGYILELTPSTRSEAISFAREKLLPKYTWKNILPLYLKYFS